MKKVILAALTMLFSGLVTSALAQEDIKKNDEETKAVAVPGKPGAGKKNVKTTEEIIIRRNGDPLKTITVEIKGDNIMVNGKPLADFKDDNFTINKRKMIIRGGDGLVFTSPDKMGEDYQGFNDFENMQVWGNDDDRTEEKRAFLGVTSEDDEDGAKVTGISNESSAAKAGLAAGDIITKLGDKKITGPESLAEAVGTYKPGEEVTITYKRSGKESAVKAKLGERVQRRVRSYSMTMPRTGSGRVWTVPRGNMPDMNIQMQELGERMQELRGMRQLQELQSLNGQHFDYNNGNFYFYSNRPKLGLKIQDVEDGDGVKITEVEAGTAADKAGLKKDDIITEIGGKKIKSTDDAREELKPAAGKSSYSIKARRSGSDMNFEVKIPKKIKTASL